MGMKSLGHLSYLDFLQGYGDPGLKLLPPNGFNTGMEFKWMAPRPLPIAKYAPSSFSDQAGIGLSTTIELIQSCSEPVHIHHRDTERFQFIIQSPFVFFSVSLCLCSELFRSVMVCTQQLNTGRLPGFAPFHFAKL